MAPERTTRRRALMMAGFMPAAVTGTLFSSGHAHGLSAADWPSAPAPSTGLRAAALAEALDAGAAVPGLRALLVAHHGALVAERYYAGATADVPQPINSVTKSVCSLLVGLALRDGRLQSLDHTVAQLLPEAVAELPDSPAAPVTLRQILSGRTGLAFDPMRFGQLAGSRPMVRYVLSRPAEPVPPPGWSYNDAMVSLLAPMLTRAQGVNLSTLAQRQLFEPLGIERFDWRRDRDGQPLSALGLVLRPRDLLKFAAVMADGGRWQGRQVLPEAWVTESLTPQGPSTWRAGPVADVGYGLLWFTGCLHGQRVAWGWGYGGQFALLVPELKLAVATAATSPPWSALREQTDAVMALVGQMVQAAT